TPHSTASAEALGARSLRSLARLALHPPGEQALLSLGSRRSPRRQGPHSTPATAPQSRPPRHRGRGGRHVHFHSAFRTLMNTRDGASVRHTLRRPSTAASSKN